MSNKKIIIKECDANAYGQAKSITNLKDPDTFTCLTDQQIANLFNMKNKADPFGELQCVQQCISQYNGKDGGGVVAILFSRDGVEWLVFSVFRRGGAKGNDANKYGINDGDDVMKQDLILLSADACFKSNGAEDVDMQKLTEDIQVIETPITFEYQTQNVPIQCNELAAMVDLPTSETQGSNAPEKEYSHQILHIGGQLQYTLPLIHITNYSQFTPGEIYKLSDYLTPQLSGSISSMYLAALKGIKDVTNLSGV